VKVYFFAGGSKMSILRSRPAAEYGSVCRALESARNAAIFSPAAVTNNEHKPFAGEQTGVFQHPERLPIKQPSFGSFDDFNIAGSYMSRINIFRFVFLCPFGISTHNILSIAMKCRRRKKLETGRYLKGLK
jgi:hypothetical protein